MADRTPPDAAYVGSSDAIVDLRAAVLTFIDEVAAALESVRGKAGKAMRWLDEDAPAYWRTQEQQSYDAVATARTALSICRTQTVAGRRKSCIEEKAALRKSQERQEVCRLQKSRTKAAALSAHDAADDYRAQIAALERFLETDLPKLLAILHRTSVSLDAYSATRPSSPRAAPRPISGPGDDDEPGESDAPAEEEEPS